MGQVITDLMIKTSYDYAKRVFHNQIELNHALNDIVSLSGMYRGLALAYISAFRSMIEGKVYKIAIKTEATMYFLVHIHKDYGALCFSKALESVDLHIDYYKNIKGIKLNKIKEIVEDLKDKEVLA
ncbi:hypothetical protein HFE03_07545 [Paenibacillus sp. EKM102P]|uniref:hypothetical protein n=1 Tax=unclassified Paenibacillus TaxID=185978 RepID=UPI00142D4705|nr:MULTISPECIES: hypothetical protein [unclassified Paenibacillus]KAF6620499.1 hypothetical protein HFE00_05450 [Paenibacillus sp. EKM101P]KAF6623491.1 hypothetical protein HFE03_07545 [Paenibacillus sp. EKM102P]KAF6633946.1 hypothetical protein HFE01_06960 [Paenibacillus sp. EKM10P]KAF6649473.1 hypothetical protein HFE02_01925 [Paenibacillus sp. EKM11P]